MDTQPAHIASMHAVRPSRRGVARRGAIAAQVVAAPDAAPAAATSAHRREACLRHGTARLGLGLVGSGLHEVPGQGSNERARQPAASRRSVPCRCPSPGPLLAPPSAVARRCCYYLPLDTRRAAHYHASEVRGGHTGRAAGAGLTSRRSRSPKPPPFRPALESRRHSPPAAAAPAATAASLLRDHAAQPQSARRQVVQGEKHRARVFE